MFIKPSRKATGNERKLIDRISEVFVNTEKDIQASIDAVALETNTPVETLNKLYREALIGAIR
jgi:hypothetical protein